MNRPAACHRLSAGALAFVLSLATAWAADPPQSSASASSPTNPVVVPFEFRRGHIMVPARLEGSVTQSFVLDSGYSLTMLSPGQPDLLQLRRTGRVTIVGIAGEEPADMFEGPTFDFAGTAWKPRRVAAFPANERRSGSQRRAVLGSSFFRRFVVEVDPRAKTLRLHEPKDYRYAGPGEVLPLTFKESTPIVEATIHVTNRAPIRAQFEIDTGCDGGLCLGSDFVSTNQLAALASQPDSGRRGVGGGTRTRTGHLPQLQLGQLKIDRPAASFFLEGSPVDAPLAGHIGLELLREFKTVFDYSRRQLILERP